MPAWCRGSGGTRGYPLACTLLSQGAFLLTSLIPFLASADVVTDGSLGDGNSPAGPDFWISEAMGERPGGGPNLFHSFFEFNLGETQSATFDGPDAVENILGRVTGGSRSEIFGAIRTAPSLGEVDLYLMNPSGMMFGESASLDVQGSFHATTADYIGLGGGGERFYANPSRTSLLSAAPPSAFGFLGGGAADDGLAAITVESAALEVRDGESLSLVGRDIGSGGVEISGAHLLAAGGRIDLVSVGSAGEVRLGAAESSEPEPPELTGFEALGALDIVSGSSVDVSGDPPGSVWIRGGRLVVEESKVLAVNQGPRESGGRISIAADESVLVWQEALESSQQALIDAGTEAVGGGGEIDVTAPELTIEKGKVTSSTATASEGAAGTIDLDVGTLVIWNDEEISAVHLLVGVSAETRGSGPGGTIKVTADSAELTGGRGAGISAATTGPDAAGKAGTIEIDAGSVDIRDGGMILAGAVGESTGDAGTISIRADSVLVQGARLFPNGSAHESIIWAGTFGIGDAGTVAIEADSVDTRDGGVITATAAEGSTGDAGTVDITAGSVDLWDGGYISADAQRATTGHAGTVSIHADSVLVQGAILFPDGSGWGSSLAAFTSGAGHAGTVDITAGSVDIRDGGLINASANLGSSGDAGTITVEATDSVFISHGGGDPFSLSGVLASQLIPAGIYSGTLLAGDSGSITVSAPEITVTEGAIVGTSTAGGGDAGDVTLRGERITISGGAFVDSTSVPFYVSPGGAAGSVTLEATESITVEGRSAFGYQSRVASATLGPSDSGSVSLRAPLIVVDDGAIATTSVKSTLGGSGGRAGEIVLEAEELHVIGGGRVDSSSLTAGQAGSIRVVASELLRVEGAGSGISSRTGGQGLGGDVTLRAPRIEVSDGGEVSAESSAGLQETGDIFASLGHNPVGNEGLIAEPPPVATGNAGSVTLEAEESIAVEGRSAFGYQSRVASATLGPGDAGSVSLRAPRILVDDGAIATTSVASPDAESGGRAGEIVLEAEELHVIGGGRMDSSSLTAGQAGSIRVVASESLRVAGAGSGIASRTGGPGLGGDVTLRSPRIEVSDGGEVSAESSAGLQETRDIFASLDDEGLIAAPPPVATGNAGSVSLEADQVLVRGGSIATHSESADGGDVTILATEMLHLIYGEITASVSSGSGGNIVIDPVFVILEGESRIVAQAIEGSGGNISITADAVLASLESVISASSQLGVQGIVEIHSPETDVAGTLASLPETFLEAAALMKERCAARKGGESAGSFVWTGRQGVSWSPDGMIPASYREAEERPEPAGLVLGTSPTTGEQVALLVGCGGGRELSRR